MRLLISGAAGLVGQNLIPLLKDCGEHEIVAVDKHPHNVQVLRRLHPEILVVEADLSSDGYWVEYAKEAECLIQLHAQIGGLDEAEFTRNNITATERLLEACGSGQCRYIVHVSSSVVNSAARDFYTESKKLQESLVRSCRTPSVILRPTLMFGWFDRKHLGWLKRFMDASPVFPVPGSGRFLRQPLFAGDFAAIIKSCVDKQITGTYDVSGLEKVTYIDLIRTTKRVAGARSLVVNVPYRVFWALLWLYALIDRDPPFTTSQLEALVTPDEFPVSDWAGTFGVTPTSLEAALDTTFNHPDYSNVELKF